jgi:deoxyribonuclease-1
MAKRTRSGSSKRSRTSVVSVLLIIGLVVLGYVRPEFGGLVNDLLGTELFPRDVASAPTDPIASDDVDPAMLPDVPSSFYQAKQLLYDEVFSDRRRSFYCGCAYGADRDVDLGSCGLQSLRTEERARRIEAEHVFPAYHFGQHRRCWREALCTDSQGRPFKGRDCCEEIDPVFRAAHNDLHNLVPAVGAINGDRSNLNWGMVEGEPRAYGACNFEVDRSIRRAEPPDAVMGDIARIYFYMADTYRIRLSDQDRQLLSAWSRLDPVDAAERARDARIAAIQGNHNPYVR